MANYILTPFYHPTTVCFVDDNESFLNSLDLELPDNWAYESFIDPADALNYLNRPPERATLVERCFTKEQRNDDRAVLHMNLSVIEEEITHVDRFERVSVAVIDYAMPAISGLDICREMKDPYTIKAILTGVADEKVAVEAFNAGIIDHFMPKSRASIRGEVLAFVADLQYRYFDRQNRALHTNLGIDPPPFLVDPMIADFMQQFVQSRHFVEYYVSNDPPGFLLATSAGRQKRLLIFSADQVKAQLIYANAQHAPEEILRAMANFELIAFFGESPEDYYGNDVYPWDENVVPATKISGTRDWYVGIVDNPPFDVNFNPSFHSYNAYLKRTAQPRN